MELDENSLDAYGLRDLSVLKVAVELAPQLFAALAVSARVSDSQYPISEGAGMDRAFLEAGEAGIRFPNEFLPITDRYDLLRKAYMTIVSSRESDARIRIEAARRGELQVQSSHPFHVGDL